MPSRLRAFFIDESGVSAESRRFARDHALQRIGIKQMAQVDPWKDPEKAENQLLEIIRGGDVDQFTLTISRVGTAWTVRMEWHGQKIIGTGPSFAEAWHGQEPIWA